MMDKVEARKTELLTAALGYAERGWSVFPVHSITDSGGCSCNNDGCERKAKHPHTAHGLDDATTDPDSIREFWNRWPDANTGIATGTKSGLVVLDVDPRHAGEESLATLVRKHGEPPSTLAVKTGGGGWHFYFCHPGHRVPNSAGKLGRGLDVRGDGGYVLAPPSNHVSGGIYRWIEQ